MAHRAGGDHRLFGAKFEEAFPELEDALLEWQETCLSHAGTRADAGEWIQAAYRGGVLGGPFPCSNPLCREGGFELEHLFATMIQAGETTREGIAVCVGWEGEPGADRHPCVHYASYRIALKFRDLWTALRAAEIANARQAEEEEDDE
jgi:hypothetical protein